MQAATRAARNLARKWKHTSTASHSASFGRFRRPARGFPLSILYGWVTERKYLYYGPCERIGGFNDETLGKQRVSASQADSSNRCAGLPVRRRDDRSFNLAGRNGGAAMSLFGEEQRGF